MKKPRRTKSSGARLMRLAASSVLGLVLLVYYLTEATTAVRVPQGDAPAELYSNQLRDDLRQTVTSAIDGAQRSVLLLIYSLTDDKVISALRRKAEAGIPVTVIVDAKASPKAKRQLGPSVKTVRRAPPGLMHLKILVVDDDQVWIGSTNMTYDSLRVHGNLMIGLRNSGLAQAIKQRALGMPAAGAGPASQSIAFLQGEQKGVLWFLPNPAQATDRILALLRSAQKSVRVAMFTWTRPDFTQAVIDAHKRGLDVAAVVDRRQGQGAGAETVSKLARAGVPVYLSRGDGLLHHKTLIVDERILVTGSANWTRAAFKINDDCFLTLEPLTDDQRSQLNNLWQVLLLEAERVKVDGDFFTR